jgi:protein TonB
MRQKLILMLAFIAVAVCTQAQTNNAKADTTGIFTVTEQMPVFPGGESEMMSYLSNNIHYPKVAMDNGIQGKVYVQFIINPYGDVVNAKIVRGIGTDCDEEALRVVKAMPRWIPGKQNGKIVSVYYNLPIKFTIPNKTKIK